MILDPSERRLYTDALRPPSGMRFDRGLATTFTLDLTTLLTIPLQLTLFARGEDAERLLEDGVGLLEALRRTTERLQVYCQQGEIRVPRGENDLYSLLESVVVEARAPRHGAFHPKFWVLRFVEEKTGRAQIRLLVLSRNLTQDRSWDLILRLDGRPGKRKRRANEPLARLLAALPSASAGGSRGPGRKATESLADEVWRTAWDLFEPFDEIRFHALGLEKGEWEPPESDELLVLSPFVSDGGLRGLSASTQRCAGLVSRVDELARLEPASLEPFDRVLHLHEVIAAEEGPEDVSDLLGALSGFHAKAYLAKRGWKQHVFVGSANATDAGLGGANLELLVELVGGWKKVGRADEILNESGLEKILQEYAAPEEVVERSEEERRAEAQLRRVRADLIEAELGVRCVKAEETWRMVVEPGRPVELSDVASVRMWPLTLPSGLGRELPRTWAPSEPVEFPTVVSSITGFFAFHVQPRETDLELRFVLNLPIEGVPEERYGAIFRNILQNDPTRFIRYLLLLLAAEDQNWLLGGAGAGGRWDGRGPSEDVPLLEELVRSLCRDPDRLETVRAIVERIRRDPAAGQVMPDGFEDVWDVLRAELEDAR